MKVRKFRILRLRHHVSMVELGRACGLSAQRISELELSEGVPEQETIQKIQNGFERIPQSVWKMRSVCIWNIKDVGTL